MDYVVRAQRHEEGGYSLLYGKGSRKINRRAVNPGNKGWRVIEAPPELAGVHLKLKDLKAKFEIWAESVYEGGDEAGEPEAVSGPPTYTPKPSGPPKYVPQGDVRSSNNYQCDPFDPLFFTESPEREITTLGALDEVWNWIASHINEKHDSYPWATVAHVLQRAMPDRTKYQEPVLRRGN